MMPPIDGAAPAGAPGLASSLGPGLSQDDFLLLLVTQLQNQDPLKPLQAQDFASQLAEFTAMEQQLRTNDLLEAQSVRAAAELREVQGNAAIGLIGRAVVTEGDQLEHPGGTPAEAFLHSDGPASVTLRVLDASGAVVGTRTAELAGAGTHRIDMGDDSAEWAAGTYTLQVAAGDGQDVRVRPLATRTVTGVRFGQDGPVLVVGDGEVALAEVLQVSLSSSARTP